MKIQLFILNFDPTVGGAEIAARETFKHMTKKHEVKVITPRYSLKRRKKEVIKGLFVRRVGLGLPFIDKYLFPLFAFFYSLTKKADLYFCYQANQSVLAANMLNIFRKKPTFVSIQAGYTEEEVKQKFGLLYFFYLSCFKKKYTYLPVSNSLARRCKAHGVNKVKVVPNGFDKTVFNSKKDLKKISAIKKKFGLGKMTLITTSRLSKKNAVDDIIKAIANVDGKLLICGTGELESDLKQLTKKLNLSEKIKFLGQVNYKDLPNYLHASRFFIRPSLFEGFGNSFIEAMACGLPVIGTKVGGIPDFLVNKKNGLFVKVNDPKDIAKKVVVDEKLYKEMKKNCIITAKSYGWEETATKIEVILNEHTFT